MFLSLDPSGPPLVPFRPLRVPLDIFGFWLPFEAIIIPPTLTIIPPTLTIIPPTLTIIHPTLTIIPLTLTIIPSTLTILPTITIIPPTLTIIPSTAHGGWEGRHGAVETVCMVHLMFRRIATNLCSFEEGEEAAEEEEAEAEKAAAAAAALTSRHAGMCPISPKRVFLKDRCLLPGQKTSKP